MSYYSPLRYPGGKRRLANYIKLIFHYNGLLDGEYIEPFAGGASIALSLLLDGYVRRIHVNDLDRSIYAFWHSVINETEKLCKLVTDTQVSVDEWLKQKNVQRDICSTLLDLGFSTFFLNRTNRSGIITAGVIGGKNQTGKWKLDARYNKEELIRRIQKIAKYQKRIIIYNLDAVQFIQMLTPTISDQCLCYMDPPYFVKGQQDLYSNYYGTQDHVILSNFIKKIKGNWVVTYDDVQDIRKLYKECRCINYKITYSAQDRYRGEEIMFFNSDIMIPDISNPSKIGDKELYRLLN